MCFAVGDRSMGCMGKFVEFMSAPSLEIVGKVASSTDAFRDQQSGLKEWGCPYCSLEDCRSRHAASCADLTVPGWRFFSSAAAGNHQFTLSY